MTGLRMERFTAVVLGTAAVAFSAGLRQDFEVLGALLLLWTWGRFVLAHLDWRRARALTMVSRDDDEDAEEEAQGEEADGAA